MAEKDPKRWQEVIVDSPFAQLTKQEVHDYYRTPAIQKALLDAVGKREAIVRQSFSPERVVLRRKDEKGRFIHLTQKRLDDWNQKRLTEVHPTFGKKVDTLLVDVDPKEGTPWDQTLRITETAAKALQSHPDVKDVSLQFSGNRGFYVRGQLDKSIGVDRARHLTQKILGNLSQRPDVSLGVGGAIRLDTTPLKVRGSVRAPYSLDARTGLVSAPVDLKDLGKVKKKDFDIDSVLRKLRRKQAEATVGGEARDDTSASRVNWDDPLIEDSKGSNTLPTGLRYVGPTRWNSLESMQSGINRKAPEPQEDPMVMVGLQGLPKGDVPKKYGEERVFYHGTSPKRIAQILREGLDPKYHLTGADQGLVGLEGISHEFTEPKVWLTPSRRHAQQYANAASVSEAAEGRGFLRGLLARILAKKARPLEVRLPEDADYERVSRGLLGGEEGFVRTRIPPENIKQSAAGEFAPGIPASKKVHALPTLKKPQTEWMFAIQEHKAKRAGKHYDLRLVQPLTDRAHSWALPKARLPDKKDRMLLAVQQPTHKRDYALHFTGTLPAGYGAGTVTMPIKEKVKMLKMTPDRVKFERPNGEVFNMFRTKGNKWGIKQADELPPIKRIEVGLPETETPSGEDPWYLDPNLLKLLTVAGATQFLKEKLLDSNENLD